MSLATLCNTGVGLLAFSPHTPLPVGAIPLLQPSAADLGDPRAEGQQLPGGFRGCQYLLATETQLWLKSYRWVPGCWHADWPSHAPSL